MKPIYLYEEGIRPWELMKSVDDNHFATITVVQRTVNDLSYLWPMLIADISQRLPRILKWRTVGFAVGQDPGCSKNLEKNLLMVLNADLTNEDYIEKNSTSNIYSYLKVLSKSVFDLNMDSITQSNKTVLLFLPDNELSIDFIWQTFKDSDDGLDPRGMKNTLCTFDKLVICRVVEDSDTHVATQFIGTVDLVSMLIETLSNLDIPRVKRENIAKLINA